MHANRGGRPRHDARDRTDEFHRTATAFASAAAASASARRPAVKAAAAAAAATSSSASSSSEAARAFQAAEAAVSRSIGALNRQVRQLDALARKKSLFDDAAAEIEQLTGEIKRDLAATSALVAQLRDVVPSTRSTAANAAAASSSADRHADAMVNAHQVEVAALFKRFQDALSRRQKNLREMTSRKMQYARPAGGGMRQRGAHRLGHADLQHEQHQHQHQQQQLQQEEEQQLLLRPARHRYEQQRADAVLSIESTISELGEMYQKLATIISTQGEQVERIDMNMDTTIEHTESGYNELVKYYNSISSNRGLIIKIFVILIVFAVLFIVLT